MTIDVKDYKLLKEREEKLGGVGIPAKLLHTAAPKAQWYKPDGSALPALLPADPYHIRRFEKRGWSMVPSKELINQPLEEHHAHRYNRKMGSLCKIEGCSVVRTTEYKKRKV
jgi:hypothetical protein